MVAHARLKNEFTEDEKYHNLMTWLNKPIVCVGAVNQCDRFSVPGRSTYLGYGRARACRVCSRCGISGLIRGWGYHPVYLSHSSPFLEDGARLDHNIVEWVVKP